MEQAYVINDRVIIDFIHMFLHIMQKDILILPKMLTNIIVFRCIGTHIRLHSILYTMNESRMNIMVLGYTQTLQDGKLVGVDKNQLNCIMRYLITVKQSITKKTCEYRKSMLEDT